MGDGAVDADALTSAVYACLLERRLAGEPVTEQEALERVLATREVVRRAVMERVTGAIERAGGVSRDEVQASDETTAHESPEPVEIMKVAISRYESPPSRNLGSEQPGGRRQLDSEQASPFKQAQPASGDSGHTVFVSGVGAGGGFGMGFDEATSDPTKKPVVGGGGEPIQAELPGLGIDRIVDGRYRLMQLLASGGFSRVYLAERVRTHEPVVLKFLAPPSVADRRACDEHFRSEVRALGRLDHPGIAQLLDSGVYHGVYYIVMECVLGETLRSRMRREPRPELGCMMDVVSQTCDALARAHEKGVIHRDLKPENIMVEVNGDGSYRARLVDFGLAMVSVFEGEGVLPEAFAGTPRYMAPEQIRRETLTEASDLFSLGVVAYELLTGEHPFAGPTPEAIREGILEGEARDPRALVPALPEGVGAMILRMLSKEASDRPGSADDLAMAIPEFETKREV